MLHTSSHRLIPLLCVLLQSGTQDTWALFVVLPQTLGKSLRAPFNLYWCQWGSWHWHQYELCLYFPCWKWGEWSFLLTTPHRPSLSWSYPDVSTFWVVSLSSAHLWTVHRDKCICVSPIRYLGQVFHPVCPCGTWRNKTVSFWMLW